MHAWWPTVRTRLIRASRRLHSLVRRHHMCSQIFLPFLCVPHKTCRSALIWVILADTNQHSENFVYRKNAGLVRMRYIESDDNLSLRGAALKEAIEDDIKLGLIPFWVSSAWRVCDPTAAQQFLQNQLLCQQIYSQLSRFKTYARNMLLI